MHAPAFMHPSMRRYIRAGFWVWTLAASIGATIGAVSGVLGVENDRT